MTAADRVGRPVRVFVVSLLALLAIAGVVGIEAWPVTGWRLYSRLRSDTQTVYRAVVVEPDGAEQPLPVGRLPVAYHHVPRLLQSYPDASPATREDLCAGLAEGARRAGYRVAAVRVYRVDERFRVVGHRAVKDRDRTLFDTCAVPEGGP